MSEADIVELFNTEFRPHRRHFEVYTFEPANVNHKEPERQGWATPGVYVYIQGNEVVKVGKSQRNSFKRSLEHIKDNTKNDRISMAHFADDPTVRVMLFNISNDIWMHWVLALEYYFEVNLNPIIASARKG